MKSFQTITACKVIKLLLPRVEEYVKWKEVSLVSVWHNNDSNALTLEKKTVKDLPRSGRLKLWDIENIRRVLEENLQKKYS